MRSSRSTKAGARVIPITREWRLRRQRGQGTDALQRALTGLRYWMWK